MGSASIGEVPGYPDRPVLVLKFDLRVVIELGYLPMTCQGTYNLFQFINVLHEFRTVILTTNKDFTNY